VDDSGIEFDPPNKRHLPQPRARARHLVQPGWNARAMPCQLCERIAATDAEQASTERQAAVLALCRVFHQVANRPPCGLDARKTAHPHTGLVRFGNAKPFRKPQQHVIVRPPALREFDHPLVGDANLATLAPLANALDVAGDIPSGPHRIIAIRERDQHAHHPEAAQIASRVSRRDDHSSHSTDSTLAIQFPNRRRQVAMRQRPTCYLSDKPSVPHEPLPLDGLTYTLPTRRNQRPEVRVTVCRVLIDPVPGSC